VKVFPAGELGPEYVRDVLEPLPRVRLLASGGVTLESAAAFVSAGAVAVGLGSALLETEAPAKGDYGEITERARRLTQAIRAAREASP
jgi:2-dehydro-3-deoxyphosphogluconate aldolase/(4S)-4-hydroxy-2-oxoglutarate aldolase